MPERRLTATLHPSIAAIAAPTWDACAGADNPFVSHAFLSALEDSGSAGPRTGWLPQHLTLTDEAGRVLAVAPCYAKSHSYGEYVFDHGWAHAFERAGGAYYPKLQVAVPFSPVPGPRLMVRPGAPVTIAALAEALEGACAGLDLSSVHVTFCQASESAALAEAGWLTRTGVQFHWANPGYADFDAFLEALASRKRKQIRRERRDAQAGLEFITLRGGEIGAAEWAAFYRFYTATVDRKWGSAYLTPEFFSLLPRYLGDKVVLMLARAGGRPVAGALNLMGRDTLYGRNWGSDGEFPFLHFELCYYQAIEFAIRHGLAKVEAGAQGEHKIQRGYLPAATHSAHFIAHRGLRAAVSRFLEQEKQQVAADMAALAGFAPYRQASSPEP